MKPSMLGLLIAAGAFGASTIYLGMQLQDERERADQILEQSQALNARIAELEKARADLESLRMEDDLPPPMAGPQPRPGPGGPQLAQTVNAEQSNEGPPDRGNFGPPRERSEAFQKMMRSQIRANNKRLYADLGSKLGLSTEDANKLLDLITDQQASMMDRMRQMRTESPDTDRRAAMEKIQQENLAEVSNLIGADKIELYKNYQESMPARQEVDALQRQLEGNDVGLSKDQRDRMVTALAEERSRIPAPKYTDSASREDYQQAMTTWQTEYTARSEARARSILTSDQLKAYNEYQQWTQEMRQNSAARRAGREGGGPGPGMPPPR